MGRMADRRQKTGLAYDGTPGKIRERKESLKLKDAYTGAT